MTYEDCLAIQGFIEEKALALYKHEKKEFAQIGFPVPYWTEHQRGTRLFYSVPNALFLDVLENRILEAQKLFPNSFGNGNAKSVIRALQKTIGITGGIKRATNLLQNETCCYLVECNHGNLGDKILRIDLFRKLDKDKHKKGKYHFTGGILHAFKHFSYEGLSLSTGTDINEFYPTGIITLLLSAFFIEAGAFKDDNTYITIVRLNNKYNLKIVFYRELNTNVFFLKTIYKEKAKSP